MNGIFVKVTLFDGTLLKVTLLSGIIFDRTRLIETPLIGMAL
jgi:hypothetical protein